MKGKRRILTPWPAVAKFGLEMNLRTTLDECAVGEGVSMFAMVDMRDTMPGLFPPPKPDCNGVDDIEYVAAPGAPPRIFSLSETPSDGGTDFVWVRVR